MSFQRVTLESSKKSGSQCRGTGMTLLSGAGMAEEGATRITSQPVIPARDAGI
ncbi:hypothetical protein [Wolbachia endosymbiont of Ctenocephalides felis wCfeJ]|uniref:hypothetical protein n=1 Tax=Wolbachia endosymbiont of Ctenocephalides felis wCfeJ TaxID=2732594 RepID=UPI0014470547|nr:hypothetical protein [Wolbachia endosymbiont of Ctenocephalides felis wCfeJ]